MSYSNLCVLFVLNCYITTAGMCIFANLMIISIVIFQYSLVTIFKSIFSLYVKRILLIIILQKTLVLLTEIPHPHNDLQYLFESDMNIEVFKTFSFNS